MKTSLLDVTKSDLASAESAAGLGLRYLMLGAPGATVVFRRPARACGAVGCSSVTLSGGRLTSC